MNSCEQRTNRRDLTVALLVLYHYLLKTFDKLKGDNGTSLFLSCIFFITLLNMFSSCISLIILYMLFDFFLLGYFYNDFLTSLH